MGRTKRVVDIQQDNAIPKPPFLYKYYAFDKWTHRIFENNEIYLSSPESFNDPFDSKIRFVYEGSRADRKRLIREWWGEKVRHRSAREGLALEKSIRKRGLDIEKTPAAFQELGNSIRRRLSVFCMTEDKNNILMWSHYADKHSGFCLEFQSDNIFFSSARPVKYDSDIPPLNLLKLNWNDLLRKMVDALLVKAPDWAYEKEWRIVAPPDNGGVREYPSHALTSVFFGCRMSPQDKQRLKQWCCARKLPPALYVAKENQQNYALDIIPL